MKERRVAIRAAARRDFAEHYHWLSREAGLEIAERFLVAADAEFAKLVSTPGMGAPVRAANPHLKGMRKWPVDGFESVLIFYVRRPTVSIVRVIHVKQDWWALLGRP